MDFDTVVTTRGYWPFKKEKVVSAFSAHTADMPNIFVHDYEKFSLSLFSTWDHSHAPVGLMVVIFMQDIFHNFFNLKIKGENYE